MTDGIGQFESVVRRAHRLTEARSEPSGGLHPFDERDVHPGIPDIVRDLFDNGHYSQATFEAFKFLDKEVQRHSGIDKSGFNLMMQVFPESSPVIQLTPLSNTSECDEQKGFQFIFAGPFSQSEIPVGMKCRFPTLQIDV